MLGRFIVSKFLLHTLTEDERGINTKWWYTWIYTVYRLFIMFHVQTVHGSCVICYMRTGILTYMLIMACTRLSNLAIYKITYFQLQLWIPLEVISMWKCPKVREQKNQMLLYMLLAYELELLLCTTYTRHWKRVDTVKDIVSGSELIIGLLNLSSSVIWTSMSLG